MKNILILLALVVCFCVPASAQLAGYTPTVVYNALTYADDDIDTTATYTVGSVDKLTLRAYLSDSASVVYKFDYRVRGASAWTAVTAASADTVVKTAAGYSQIVLRDNLLERIPGVSTQFRVRAEFQSSANSANSGATHTGWLEYSR